MSSAKIRRNIGISKQNNGKVILTLREPLSYQAELCFDDLGQYTGDCLKYAPRHHSRQLENVIKKEEEDLNEVANYLERERHTRELSRHFPT